MTEIHASSFTVSNETFDTQNCQQNNIVSFKNQAQLQLSQDAPLSNNQGIVEGRGQKENSQNLQKESTQDLRQKLVDSSASNKQGTSISYTYPEAEGSIEEQEENSDFYYSSSTIPQYLLIPRYQRQNYFDRLNRSYLQKLNNSNPTQNLNTNSDAAKPKKKVKGIKFDSFVYEVTFDKEQEPIAVKNAHQEEVFIVFDAEAQEEEQFENHSEAEQSFEEVPHRQDQFVEIQHFDMHDEDFKIKFDIIESDAKNQEDLFLTQKDDRHESLPSHVVQDMEEEHDRIMEIGLPSPFQDDEVLNSFKRDANGKYLLQTSSSDSNSNDSSNEAKEIDCNEEFESYFELFIHGRKINPNALQ